MAKFKDFIYKSARNKVLSDWLVLLFSIGLFITSFFLPPKGFIDPSVLAAVGETGILYILIFKLTDMIQSIKDGKSVTIKKGETELTVSSNKEEKEE